jgi:hypothetical protein
MTFINSKFSLFFLCISVIVLFSELIYAQSSPPLILNDPGTPGPGNWEINIMSSLEHSTVNDEWQAVLFDINYGVGERIQLMAGLPYVVEWEDGAKDLRGFDGMELGIKYRFLDQDIFGSDISVYPKIYFPIKEEDAGKEFSLPFEWHKEWKNFGITAEVGHVWVQGESSRWEGGIGFAYFFGKVNLLAELHSGVREAPLDLTEPMVNVGMTWELLDNVSLFFSVGKSFNHNEDETNFWSLAGVQLLL